MKKRFDDLIGTIRDERVRRRYQLDLRFKLSNLFFEQARSSRRDGRKGSENLSFPGTARERVAASDDFGMERLLLGLSVRYPHLLDRNFERFFPGCPLATNCICACATCCAGSSTTWKRRRSPT
ncbi:hypothetical protein QW131_16075 [Roseibium salinum]|nr:hypothetical protein [Roseibium salinum]